MNFAYELCLFWRRSAQNAEAPSFENRGLFVPYACWDKYIEEEVSCFYIVLYVAGKSGNFNSHNNLAIG